MQLHTKPQQNTAFAYSTEHSAHKLLPLLLYLGLSSSLGHKFNSKFNYKSFKVHVTHDPKNVYRK